MSFEHWDAAVDNETRVRDRLGGWGGVGYLVCMLTAWVVFWQTNLFTTFGETPDSDATAEQLVAFYSEHRRTQLAAGLVWALALAPLALFLARIYARMRQSEGSDVTASSAYLFGAMGFLVAPMMWVTGVLGVSFRVGETDSSITQYNHDLYLLPIVTCAPLWALMFAAIAFQSLRAGSTVIPRPLAILAVVTAPTQFLYFGSAYSPSGIWWSSNQGILVAFLAYGCQLTWIAATSVWLIRRGGAVKAAAASDVRASVSV